MHAIVAPPTLTPVQRSIKEYHALVASNRAAAMDGVPEMHEEMRRRGLLYGDRLLCPFLRPFFLSRAEYERIQAVVRTLQPAFDLVTSLALKKGSWLDWLGLSDLEKQFVRYDPGYRGATLTSRLDAFLTANSFKFVEYNAEAPTGIGYGDTIAELFLKLPIVRRFRRSHRLRYLPVQPVLARTILSAYRQWGGRVRPHIAIVDWEDVSTRSEFEIIREYLERTGLKVLICDPRHLEIRKKHLYCGDFRIDIIYRRVVVHEFLERLRDCLPMAEAYRDGLVCVINSFRTKILHKKALFAALHEESIQQALPPETRQAILDHIPWTRKVGDCRVKLNGKDIELLAYIEGNRRKLVLKPNDDYGGRGIVIGWETEQDDWNQYIRKAMEGGYVVQQRVEVRKEPFPDTRENLRLREMLVDLDPFVFAGKGVHGVLTRLSNSALSNVTSGAGQVPAFLLD